MVHWINTVQLYKSAPWTDKINYKEVLAQVHETRVMLTTIYISK